MFSAKNGRHLQVSKMVTINVIVSTLTIISTYFLKVYAHMQFSTFYNFYFKNYGVPSGNMQYNYADYTIPFTV